MLTISETRMIYREVDLSVPSIHKGGGFMWAWWDSIGALPLTATFWSVGCSYSCNRLLLRSVVVGKVAGLSIPSSFNTYISV